MNTSIQSGLIDNGHNTSNDFLTVTTGDRLSSSINDSYIDTLDLIVKYCKEKNRNGLKEIFRSQNWPIFHPIRGKLWSVVAQAYKTSKSVPRFDEIDDTVPIHDEAPHKLPSFVDPAFCRFFRLNKKGQRTIEKMLWALALKHSTITMCPLLYPMTALFLHYLSAEDTFVSLNYLLDASSNGINGSDSRTLLPQSRRQLDHEAYVLLRLTNQFGFMPRRNFYNEQRTLCIKKKEVDVTFRDWLQWIFVGLPFGHLVRVVDCFLIEGTKFLYRIGLALLLLYWKDCRKTSPNAFTIEAMVDFCEQIRCTPEELIRLSTNLNRLSIARIESLHSKANRSTLIISPRSPDVRNLSELKVKIGNDGIENGNSSFGSNIIANRAIKSANSASNSPRRQEMVSINCLQIKDTIRMVPSSLKSSVIERWGLEYVWEWLPARLLVREPRMIYCSSIDGVSLNTFYKRVEGYVETVLLVRTVIGEVFGAFCSAAWSDRLKKRNGVNQYFGTGETFLFSLRPIVAHYPWVGIQQFGYSGDVLSSISSASPNSHDVAATSQLFMSASSKFISIGAGNGVGLYLDENLTKGKSETCDTFCNKPLAAANDFVASTIEVIGFVS